MKYINIRISDTNNVSFVLYKWIVLICALQSFACSFFWDVSNLVCIFALFLSSLLLISNKWHDKSNTSWFVLYLIAFIFTQDNNLLGWIIALLSFFNLYVLFNLKTSYKHELLCFIRKSLGLIIIVSLIGWIIYLLGVSLPHFDTGWGDSPGGDFHYYFDNYYFFLVNKVSFFRYIIPRFSSVFLEPGYLGCLMSILLISDHFRFGKGHLMNVVFLVALLFSFSLAGYLLTVFGLIIDRFARNNGRMVWLSLILLLVFGAYQFFKDYKGGNNIVNETIILRLEIDKSDGSIAGYNRSSESLEYYFWNRFIYSSELLFGDKDVIERYSDSADNEVSWHGYIIRYGLIAILFLLLYYFYPVLKHSNDRRKMFGVGLIFLLVFSQTIHMTHSLMYIVLFILSIAEIDFENNKYLNNGNYRVLSTTVSSH